MSKYGQTQYSISPYGNSNEQTTASDQDVVAGQPVLQTDEFVFTRDLAFPYRYSEDCDVVLSNNDVVVNDSINLSAFIRKNGIPLLPLGSGVDQFVFDPNDRSLQAYMGYRLQVAIELGVPFVNVDPELQYIEDENKLSVAVNYINNRTNQVQSTLLAADRVKTDF